uniref:P/Homo B domain-containing protein n=1 Tax=Panagrellus redivivus TaxID=6233 RepID=A0A7E4VES7_PANRE
MRAIFLGIFGLCLAIAVADRDTELVADAVEELLYSKRAARVVYEKPEQSQEVSDEGEWVLKVHGGLENAIRIANETNIALKRAVRGFDNLFVFEQAYSEHSRRKRSIGELYQHLQAYSDVDWVEHQREKRRVKRGLMWQRQSSPTTVAKFNDPLWPVQWQVHTYNTSKKGDMRIVDAWGLGYTGKGIVVSILDDGVDHRHRDLAPNYEPRASYDLNGNDPDPTPQKDGNNKHGTRCAGEVAMVANNSICGVGVAFNAKIAGVRMLDGRITDRLEGEALSMNANLVDIYSASWGPSDDGKTVEAPGRLASLGILKGIRNGRNGRGTIYVWASGNGGSVQDDCNCDGYAQSLYTFSVSSAAEDGSFPWYAEQCPSTLTTTYSSGGRRTRMIATTDTDNKCTTQHSGTSASAPIAAGIIALALEANPNLTWRDVQHLAVWTSNPAPLYSSVNDWHVNGAGLVVSYKFGFGLMDAYEFVRQGKTWQNVPQFKACATEFPGFAKRSVSSNFDTIITFETDACKGLSNEINFLEHVQLVADIDHQRRGNLALWLVSPSGTKTRLLKPRPKDTSNAGFHFWPFTSLHTWGENPRGRWQLMVDDTSNNASPSSGVINNISLIIYGTTEMPSHYGNKKLYADIDLNALQQKRNLEVRSAFRYINKRSTEAPPPVDHLEEIVELEKRKTVLHTLENGFSR